MEKYDVIAIGAGSAGLANSGVTNEIGLKTLLIEQHENRFGGAALTSVVFLPKLLSTLPPGFMPPEKPKGLGWKYRERLI